MNTKNLQQFFIVVVIFLGHSVVCAEDTFSIQSKAQSAYFEGNATQLKGLSGSSAAGAISTDPRELYTAAYVQFRALQLSIISKRMAEAEKYGDLCLDILSSAIKINPKFVEALTLQSACYGYMTNLGGMAAIRNGSRSGKSIQAALALDLRNPRTLLIDGFGIYFRPKFVGGDKVKGCARFREAAALFDTGGTVANLNAQWGAPEAHYWVGRCAKDNNDLLLARKEFERALALAPNFGAAQRSLAR